MDKHIGFLETLPKIIREFPGVRVSLTDTRSVYNKVDALRVKPITDPDTITTTLRTANTKTRDEVRAWLSKVKYSRADVDFAQPGSFGVFRQKGRNYMIASAENSMGTVLSEAENKTRTAAFRKFLDESGIVYHPQKGKYGGNIENSQLIEITSPQQRQEIDSWLQRNSPQAENIIVRDGKVVRYDPRTRDAYMVDLRKTKAKDLSLEDGTTDFYSEIEGRKYRFPLYDETVEKPLDKDSFSAYYRG